MFYGLGWVSELQKHMVHLGRSIFGHRGTYIVTDGVPDLEKGNYPKKEGAHYA